MMIALNFLFRDLNKLEDEEDIVYSFNRKSFDVFCKYNHPSCIG